MLHSMTGYGKAEKNYSGKRISIEIKSLNSKQGDIFTRMPTYYKEKDLDIRKLISEQLQRGKIELNINVENFSDESNHSLNKALAKKYYEELKALAWDIEEKSFNDYLPLLVKMPDVMVNAIPTLEKKEWSALREGVLECCQKVNEFRIAEGAELEKDFLLRISNIETLLEKIPPHEQERMDKITNKIKKDLNDMLADNQYDKNRFEQELIYYLEKLDITEEKVRLKNHCDYFRKTLNLNTSSGKKLNFIGQEIGREINTIGSKANHTDIQHIVVMMKDELEKIKEQLSNIL